MRTVEETRIGAYVVCVEDGRILLSRYAGRGEGGRQDWGLPGGGIDHGEHPHDGAIRETAEETGYIVEIEALLGIGNRRESYQRGLDTHVEHQTLQIIYLARRVGGELSHEIRGSSDRAAWIDLDDLASLPRVSLVDRSLELARTRPPAGVLPQLMR